MNISIKVKWNDGLGVEIIYFESYCELGKFIHNNFNKLEILELN